MKRAALLVLVALSACGPRYGKRVPNGLLEKLSYESRIELLEAENDLALAIDHLDEGQAEMGRARDALRRAKERLSAAEDEVGDAADAISKEVATLAVGEAKARVDYLRAKQQSNVKNEDLLQLALRCAHARFQLARVTVARKAKVEGAESLSPAEFEEQAKECEAEVATRKSALAAEEDKRAAEAKTTWDEKRAELARKTFDARASPYVE